MINKICRLILTAMVLSSITLTQVHSAQLVIIIDDIGNNYQLGNAMVELKGPLTLAFLPHTPYAKKLANKAYLQQKEIILHAPMENTVKAALGPGALTQALTETELKQSLKKSIASIPHVQGMNNHMGSALTQNKKAMTWVMETLQTEQLYFVDSLTSPNSVAYQQAIKHQLPALRRHIFLDNDKSLEALTRQWNKALRIAHNTGRAILIGHPYTESHAFLAKQLPKLAAKGIELIPASQLLLQQAWQEFDKGKLQTQTMPNRYLLQDNNLRASDNNEQKLISHNLGNQPH
ncbi:MAG: polysaccharide deacetylase 2 family uncharacterized protein YibQ [Oleispira sp.]|jgi:polysaccharide deacetylase 2 family uncharacterized protein YibQ